MGLDKKDVKILKIISDNARIPVTELAKQVELSKDAVSYRLSNLEANGAISKYISYISLPALGYTSFQVTLRLAGGKESLEKTVEFLKKHPFCINAFTTLGAWDVLAEFAAQNEVEVAKIMNEIAEHLGNMLEAIDSKMPFYLYKRPSTRGLLEQEMEHLETNENPSFGSAKLDETDVKILSLLSEHGRIKLTELAEKLGIERDVVAYRKKQLEEKGVIDKYQTRLDLSFFEYSDYYLTIKMKNMIRSQEELFKRYIQSSPNVTYGFRSAAAFEAILFYAARSPKEFHEQIMELRNTFSSFLQSFEVLVVLKNHHYTLFPVGIQSKILEKRPG